MKIGRLAIRNRVSVVALFLLFAFAAELLLRMMHRAMYGIPVTTFHPTYQDTRFQESPFLVFGPRVDWKIQGKPHPELATYDSNGFRTIEPLVPRLEGEIRIVAMGGSTTENVWNDAGIHWPLVAQCILRREGYPVRIINGAMSAYSTAQSLVRLQFSVLDKAQPDIVLVMHLINDLTVTYEAAARGREVDSAYLVKYGQKGYTGEIVPSDVVVSRLYDAIAKRIGLTDDEDLLSPSSWTYDLEPGLEYFRRNLRLLALVVRDRGAEPIFLTMPRSSDEGHYRASQEEWEPGRVGLGQLPALDLLLQDFEVFNTEIRESAARLGIHLVDLAHTVPDRRDLFLDPVHFTTEGVLEMGTRVAEGLVPRLPPPGSEPIPPGRECELVEPLLDSADSSPTEESDPSNGVRGGSTNSVGRRRSAPSASMDRCPRGPAVQAA